MKKKILVAPLNWGLGHATRCIPIINALLKNNFEPIVASDGVALELLKKEFPELTCLELPGYNISYSKKGYFLKLKLLKHSPKIINAIKAERKATVQIVETHNIDGIISDNRFGVYSKLVPSIFLTHQLQVLSGNTTWFSTKLHLKIIRQFDACWVPDNAGHPNLSGKLGHEKPTDMVVTYIGPLSRFKKIECEMRYDIMVMLSGPEPQRTILEKKLLGEFKNYDGKVLFVRGVVEKESKVVENGKMTICNYLIGKELEQALNESDLILCRSGYTTIMDLTKLNKKAFFIPTPGQFEQEYLAQRFEENNFAPCSRQDQFEIQMLKKATNYKGLEAADYDTDFSQLFQFFEGK